MKENTPKPETVNAAFAAVIDMPEQFTTCPNCGGEVGLWSDLIETQCFFCGCSIFQNEGTNH